MTADADAMRARRRAFAAPDGFHDRLIRALSVGLPAAVGVVVAVMVITPLFPRNEISFLLDRNKVEMTSDRLSVDRATYRGEDNRGRAFFVSAGNAVQHSAADGMVALTGLVAQMAFEHGAGQVSAPTARYAIAADRLMVDGPAVFHRADGYDMRTSAVTIDLKTRRATGAGGVTGAVPTGTFSADRIDADLAARTLVLDGHARLRMVQKRLH